VLLALRRRDPLGGCFQRFLHVHRLLRYYLLRGRHGTRRDLHRRGFYLQIGSDALRQRLQRGGQLLE
jgi:hypothetical protein